MIRQFLAILALVTGLTAISEPARAAHVGAAVEAAMQGTEVSSCAGRSVLIQLDGEILGQRNDGAVPCQRAGRSTIVPAIRLQADRAHE